MFFSSRSKHHVSSHGPDTRVQVQASELTVQPHYLQRTDSHHVITTVLFHPLLLKATKLAMVVIKRSGDRNAGVMSQVKASPSSEKGRPEGVVGDKDWARTYSGFRHRRSHHYEFISSGKTLSLFPSPDLSSSSPIFSNKLVNAYIHFKAQFLESLPQ